MPLNPERTKLVQRMRESAHRITHVGSDRPAKVFIDTAAADLAKAADVIEDMNVTLSVQDTMRGQRLARALQRALRDWFIAEYGFEPKISVQEDSFPGQLHLAVRHEWVLPVPEGTPADSLRRQEVRLSVGVKSEYVL